MAVDIEVDRAITRETTTRCVESGAAIVTMSPVRSMGGVIPTGSSDGDRSRVRPGADKLLSAPLIAAAREAVPARRRRTRSTAIPIPIMGRESNRFASARAIRLCCRSHGSPQTAVAVSLSLTATATTSGCAIFISLPDTPGLGNLSEGQVFSMAPPPEWPAPQPDNPQTASVDVVLRHRPAAVDRPALRGCQREGAARGDGRRR